MMARFFPAIFSIAVATALTGGTAARADDARSAPKKSDADFQIQGEYSGDVQGLDSCKKLGVQVVALGDGKFHAVGYIGGLPGDGWDQSDRKEADGTLTDGAVSFTLASLTASVKPGGPLALSIGPFSVELKKIERKSPTQGATPPAGALVLFDGRGTDKWEEARVTRDGLLMEGARTKVNFRSCKLHVEFLVPFMPDVQGQGRGNSGCYFQDLYEVQILDSFGLKPADDDCGSIYSIKAPDVNMCYPPQVWQTFDIDFTAPTFEDGEKVKNAVISVKHNGVQVQKDVEVPRATTLESKPTEVPSGPFYLQNHSCPVRFRNIWLVEKPDPPKAR